MQKNPMSYGMLYDDDDDDDGDDDGDDDDDDDDDGVTRDDNYATKRTNPRTPIQC